MKAETTNRAILYCRVSGKSQKERGDGLRSQERSGADFARSRGLVIDQVFFDTMTGGVAERPGMHRMIAFLRQHPKGTYHVIIEHIDRWARDVHSHWELRALLAEAGGILISPTIEFGNSPAQKLNENIQASFAQHFRDHNAEQTLSRMKSRALNGWWPFAVPVGYRYEKMKGNGKICVRDEPLASTIQEGLEGFASGRFDTQAALTRFFQSRPEFPRNRHGRVEISHVRQVLTRVFYAGIIDHERWGIHMVQGHHAPLISFATYKAIQDKLNGKTRLRPRHNDGAFALRGHVLCGCGTPLTACWSRSSTGKQYGYYLCPDKTKACPEYGKSIPLAKIEGEFEALLQSLTPSVGLVELAKEAIRDHWERHTASAKRLIEAGKLELSKLDRSIDQLLDRIVETDSETIVAAYERKLKMFEERRAELRDQVARTDEKKPDPERAVRTALKFLASPCILWNSGVPEERSLVAKLVFPKRLTYSRETGFRTPLSDCLFLAFSSFEALKEKMAPTVGRNR